MRKSVLVLFSVVLAALSGNAVAGYYDAPEEVSYSTGKSPLDSDYRFSKLDHSAPCPCFEPGPVEFDIFAGYAWADDAAGPFSEDGFTGGLGVQTFYSELLGFRLQGTYWDSQENVGTASGSVIFRFPFERHCLAPFVYGGPGGLFPGDGNGEWTGHLGVGLDYRFTRIDCLGLVLDFRRTWAEQSDGYYMLTLGLRFSL